MCGINSSSSQWCGCIFILSYTHLNLALLLHKQGLVATGVATTVFIVRNCRWAEVEDERTKVNTEDETAVFASAKKLYEASLQYLDRMREIEAQQLKILR